MSSQITVVLPRQIWIETFKYINEAKDVVDLNLVCKFFKTTNESIELAEFRIGVLKLALPNFHFGSSGDLSYKDYVKLAKSLISEKMNADFIKEIQNLFSTDPAQYNPIPSNEAFENVLLVLKTSELLRDDRKIEGFLQILNASNATDDIARKYYNCLPKVVQDDFKFYIWLQNAASFFCGGHDEGITFGDHIIESSLRGPTCILAAEQYLAQLRKSTSESPR